MGGVVNQVGNAVRQVTNNPVAQVLAPTSMLGTGMVNDLISPQEQQAPTAPGIDPRLAEIQREQIKQADEFKKNLPGMKDQAFGQAASAEKRRLAQELTATNQGYSNRGLLYSGMNSGAQAKARAESGTNLASSKAEINSMYDDEANRMRQQAVSTGLGIQQSKQATQDSIYKQALENMAQRRGNLAAIGGAAGGMVGGAMGRKG